VVWSEDDMMHIIESTYDCIHGRSPAYFRNICSPIVSVPFRSRLRSADNVLRPHIVVHAVSASRHLRFGTCCHLISWTVMLAANSSSRALRLGSLCKPTHKRRLWELCLSSALQILDLIDWSIDSCLLLRLEVGLKTQSSADDTAVNWRN